MQRQTFTACFEVISERGVNQEELCEMLESAVSDLQLAMITPKSIDENTVMLPIHPGRA